MASRGEFERNCQSVCAEKQWRYTEGHIVIPCPGDRSQGVEYRFFEFEGTWFVRLYSLIGSSRRVAPSRLTTALDLNFRLPHGAFAIHKEEIVLVDTMRVDDADSAVIAATFGYVAETADHYEKTIFGPDVH